jgi:hypothetical protein
MRTYEVVITEWPKQSRNNRSLYKLIIVFLNRRASEADSLKRWVYKYKEDPAQEKETTTKPSLFTKRTMGRNRKL